MGQGVIGQQQYIITEPWKQEMQPLWRTHTIGVEKDTVEGAIKSTHNLRRIT